MKPFPPRLWILPADADAQQVSEMKLQPDMVLHTLADDGPVWVGRVDREILPFFVTFPGSDDAARYAPVTE